MKSDAYLSAARLYAAAVLILLFLDLDLVSAQVRRNAWLQRVREIWAADFVARNPDVAAAAVPGVGQVSARAINAETPPLMEVAVARHDGRVWRVRAATKGTRAEVDATAAGLGVKDAEQLKFDWLLHEVEREILDRRISVPGSELSFSGYVAPWVIAGLALALLVMIRSHVGRALRDPQHAVAEPWIVLDGAHGLEKALAGTWLGALLLAPWITVGCLLAAISSQIIADGPLPWLREIVVIAGVLALVTAGGWTSVTLTADVLRLRAGRLRLGESGPD
jgi:hypothetical protein